MNAKQDLHIFHLLLTSKMGGLEKSYIDYTKALIANGHAVTAIILPDAPYKKELEKLPVKIIMQKVRGFYDISAWWRLRRIIIRHQPDLIMAHNGRAIFAAARALFTLNIPLLGISHSNNIKYSRKADKLLVLTQAMKQRFVQAGYKEEDCFVVGNMIELPKELRSKKWQKHTPPAIGFLGRLSAEKGIDNLLRAVKMLKEKNIIIHVRIGGTGAEENKLRAMAKALEIETQIEFCGWVGEDKKSDFFASIDALCLPSLHESFGLVILEAWQHNTPVIASDTDGASSIISHNINGLIYKKENISLLAEHIENLLFSEKIPAQSLTERANASLSAYGIDKFAQNLEKILRKSVI